MSSHNGCFPPIPAIATHDENRITFAKQYIQKISLPKESVEFQMLYGIRRDLQEQLVKEGIRPCVCSVRHPLVSILYAATG